MVTGVWAVFGNRSFWAVCIRFSSIYNAIQTSTATADSGPFIDFMLQEILNTLKSHQGSLISQLDAVEVRDKVRDKFGTNH